MDNKKVNAFKGDFWFTRLRDLLQQDVSDDRKNFMKLAMFWYVLIEYEGYSEDEVINTLASDGFKMIDIKEKYKLDNLSEFVNKVHYIASAKMIESFIGLINESNVSNESKDTLINDLLNKDIIETW
ncbi:hypothetical protein [Mammaliicoccus vitulinus]|uniref:hypothetical protein n=1 Tax=Mammaliicoccus vitulinus TaxID=71237 RepID=UPI00248B1A60|nr:hypothetical protein [Mammaliicoccus vitulinus]